MKFADLHLHTNFSDGSYTPSQLLRESKRCGLCAISVVDHDTVEAVEPCLSIAQEENIEVLPGIELSAEYDNTEIHILGYLIDYKNEDFIKKLKVLKNNRIERIYKIVDKLKQKMNVSLNPDTVFSIAGGGTVGRLHVARALVKEGAVSSIPEAFAKFIGDRCPAYVAGFRFSPFEAIKSIKDIGGIPVLAHPYIIKDELILKLIDFGLMGLEVYYPEHSQSMVNYYIGLAKKYNLLITGGSDFHGDAKPEIKIGSIKVPYELVEQLKLAKDKNL